MKDEGGKEWIPGRACTEARIQWEHCDDSGVTGVQIQGQARDVLNRPNYKRTHL